MNPQDSRTLMNTVTLLVLFAFSAWTQPLQAQKAPARAAASAAAPNSTEGHEITEFTTTSAAVEAAAKQSGSTTQTAVNAAETTTNRTDTETKSAAKDAQDTASDLGLKNGSKQIGTVSNRLGGLLNRGKKTEEAAKKADSRVEKNTDRVGLTGGVDMGKGAQKVLSDFVKGLSHNGSTPVVVVYGNRQQAETLKNAIGGLPAEFAFVDVAAGKAKDKVYDLYSSYIGQVWVWKDGKDVPTKMDAFTAMGGELVKILTAAPPPRF